MSKTVKRKFVIETKQDDALNKLVFIKKEATDRSELVRLGLDVIKKLGVKEASALLVPAIQTIHSLLYLPFQALRKTPYQTFQDSPLVVVMSY